MKKPKPCSKNIYSALEIKQYLESKNIIDDKFWKWFFGEFRWGDKNLLGFGPDDPNGGRTEYVNAIKKLKLKTDDEDDGVWIEKDL